MLMRKDFKNRLRKSVLWFCVVFLFIYGVGRLYYKVTGGFTLGNITYELPYDSRWDTRRLTNDELNNLDSILSQKFRYIGKGCQSYVFASDDDRYVIKFFKYQRFRPQGWLSYFTFLPGMDNYLKNKIEKKRRRLEGVFTSWKIAFEDLQPETAVIYVHLNKSKGLNKTIEIYDKVGLKHLLNMDDYEFMIQKKAALLCPTIQELMTKGNVAETKSLLDELLSLVINEYERGLADNDHALMQNTGVIDFKPIHIDAGQFIKSSKVKNPKVSSQELFNKTWKFRKWLQKTYPELEAYLVSRLKEIIGEKEFADLKPKLPKGGVGKMSHEG
jgi:hypothetical protein